MKKLKVFSLVLLGSLFGLTSCDLPDFLYSVPGISNLLPAKVQQKEEKEDKEEKPAEGNEQQSNQEGNQQNNENNNQNNAELAELRKKQEALKEIPGYYGKYAIYRDYPIDDAINRIKNGDPYIIRFKSMGDHNNKIAVHDEIKGDLELTENDQDIVILKGDGLPTYHFAHLVDDHFMRTTHVTRGEEWLSSLPIHLELFDTMGFERPKYAHLPVIMKVENGNRRKLSKRKDAEAACSFFLEQGYHHPLFRLNQPFLPCTLF